MGHLCPCPAAHLVLPHKTQEGQSRSELGLRSPFASGERKDGPGCSVRGFPAHPGARMLRGLCVSCACLEGITLLALQCLRLLWSPWLPIPTPPTASPGLPRKLGPGCAGI